MNALRATAAGNASQLLGFWGPITSTVDWCENNYEISVYVAEFFNTLSSFAMVIAGVAGYMLHRSQLEMRFKVSYLTVILVGLGSIGFHGTLQFELQMLDELPMLWTALVVVYTLVEDKPERRYGNWFPALLFLHAVFITALVSMTHGALQFYLFHISFGTAEFYSLYRVFRMYNACKEQTLKRLYHLGFLMYAVAGGVWLIDLNFCLFVNQVLPSLGIPNPQFHAWWHAVVSCGIYLLGIVVAVERERTLDHQPKIKWWLGVVPYVSRSLRQE